MPHCAGLREVASSPVEAQLAGRTNAVTGRVSGWLPLRGRTRLFRPRVGFRVGNRVRVRARARGQVGDWARVGGEVRAGARGRRRTGEKVLNIQPRSWGGVQAQVRVRVRVRIRSKGGLGARLNVRGRAAVRVRVGVRTQLRGGVRVGGWA